MIALTVTAKGQITFTPDLLNHSGIKPGGRIEIVKLPNGALKICAARRTGKIQNFFGLLAVQSRDTITIEEMNEVISAGWAGEK